MDLSFTDDQRSISDLASSVFGGEVDVERVKRIEATADTVDRELWASLAATGLLGVGLPESAGGTGGGVVELCCILEQQGRVVAPVPLARTSVAAMTIAAHGDGSQRDWCRRVVDGNVILGLAADLSGREAAVVATDRGANGWQLDGWAPTVAAAGAASAHLVVARAAGADRLFLVDANAAGISLEPTRTTNGLAHAHVTFGGVAAAAIGDDDAAVTFLRSRLRVALAALALGVAEEGVQRAAAYTSQRHQFGRPLSSFQSTAHRAADCYIDVESMRGTLWQAAWRLDQDDADAPDAALVAAWWAADAGPRVVQSVQHLHGGLGADTDYPVHRYYLWGTQLDIELGGASALLAQLGAGIASAAHAPALHEVRS